MEPVSDREIVERVLQIRERIEAAARRAGRSPSEVRLMAVTKTQPREVVEAALRAGLRLFGENRIVEAEEKFRGLSGGFELHMIGHLQRNKAKTAADLVACVQSIDKTETARALEARLAPQGRRMAILLELNSSGEASKSGFATADALLAAADEIAELPSLDIRGLMTVGPLTDDEGAVRRSFRSLATLSSRLKALRPDLPLAELSMGMSGDFEIAIEEGATLVRIGTALFGARGRA